MKTRALPAFAFLVALVPLSIGACGSTATTPLADAEPAAPDAAVVEASLPEAGPCDGREQVPADPAAKGPWAVGARTVTVGGLTHEIWYPARKGSESGREKKVYDVRYALYEEERAKISDAKAPRQPCDCFEGLPIDAVGGPYPVVVFFHGTAGFRTQSLSQMSHWASRGFVVVSTDHPKLWLADALRLDVAFGGDFGANSARLLDAIGRNDGEVAFLEKRADLSRVGAAGHSAGGGAAARFDRPGVRVRIPMASGGTSASPDLVSTLVLGGDEDGVVQPSRQRDGYASSPKRKRLALLAKAGHLAFSDLCETGKENGGLLTIAKDAGIFVPDLLFTLGTDGCKPEQLAPEKAHEIVNAFTTAELEEGLACGKPAFEELSKRFATSLSETKEER
jgi:dienelactone hydrolase